MFFSFSRNTICLAVLGFYLLSCFITKAAYGEIEANNYSSPLLAQAYPLPKPAEKQSREINQVPEKPQGLQIYVNDFGNLLSPADRQVLQEHLQSLDQSGVAQVSVLTLPTTSRELAEFGPEIMNQWGIQHQGRKDGLLILVNADAVRGHKRRGRIFVATGYRIEGVLPDSKIGRILDNIAIPDFERDQYSEGIKRTTLALCDVLEQSPELKSGMGSPHHKDEPNWFAIIAMLLALFFMSKRLQRRSRGNYRGGGPDIGGGYYGGGFSGGNDSGGFEGGFGGGDDASGGGGTER